MAVILPSTGAAGSPPCAAAWATASIDSVDRVDVFRFMRILFLMTTRTRAGRSGRPFAGAGPRYRVRATPRESTLPMPASAPPIPRQSAKLPDFR